MVPPKNSDNPRIEVILTKLEYMQRQIDHIDTQVSTNFVTKQEWEPYKTLIRMIIGLLITAVVGAGLTLVIRQ